MDNILNSIINLISDYGWLILITVIVCLYIYNTFLKTQIENYFKWKSDQAYSAKYHKNPDLLEKRLIAQQTMIEQLQAKYNRDAEKYKTKIQEKEAQKQEEMLLKLNGKGGNKLGQTYKPEYNPLMGAGTSGGYRPPKKSCCKKGGGCG